MILVDFSQIFLSNFMAYSNSIQENENSDIMVRHFVLNTLKSYRKRFSRKYGGFVICCDSKKYWRRNYFPDYKYSRKDKKKKSNHDWIDILNLLDEVKAEIKETFPYRVVEVPGAEADDIIAVLSKLKVGGKPNLIVSGDQDFLQLKKYDHVDIWHVKKKKFVDCKNPREYLINHIIEGDKGDGIPNILSDDDVYSNPSKRSKPLTKKKREAYLNDDNIHFNPSAVFDTDNLRRNFERNKKLIDLTKVPKNVKMSIMEEFKKPPVGEKSKILNYLIKHRLKNLLGEIQHF